MRATRFRSWHLAALAVMAPAVGVQAADWNQFRGPAGDGRADSRSLPKEWSETKNVRWKTPIPGKAWASPVVADGRIWLANATEDGRRLSAVCVDAATGRILHDLTLFEIAQPAFCHPYNSHASPTPLVADGKVILHFGSAGTACLDAATGEILWKRADLRCDHFRGPGSSPIPWGDLLFVNFDGADRQYVVALDRATGRTKWQTDRDIDYRSDNGDMKKAYGTPAVLEHAGRAELVSPAAVATVAYDPATGRELWKVYHGGYNAAARPLMAGGAPPRRWWATTSISSATPACSAAWSSPPAGSPGRSGGPAGIRLRRSSRAAGSTGATKTARRLSPPPTRRGSNWSRRTRSTPAAWPRRR